MLVVVHQELEDLRAGVVGVLDQLLEMILNVENLFKEIAPFLSHLDDLAVVLVLVEDGLEGVDDGQFEVSPTSPAGGTRKGAASDAA